MRKSILILFFALLGVLSARAYDYDFEVDGIYYNFISGTDRQVEVTFKNKNDYTGSMVIPSTVTYFGIAYRVTSIGSSAFYACTGLTSVTIPNSVTSIGRWAFQNCSGLMSVTIPESVTSIGVGAFQGCTSIQSPLYNSKMFVYLPQNYSGEYTIPSGIQSIVGGAFEDCSGLTEVTIPESVDAIGDYAFWGCSGLTSIAIPESVTSIGLWAFRDCTSITSPLHNSTVFAYMPQDFSGEYAIPTGIQLIAGGAFYECSGLTSVTIPEGVATIGDFAFSICSGLTSVTIPESVTSIGCGAFMYCSGLKSVEWNAVECRFLSGGLDGPFYECNITSITFGNQVTHITAYLCYGLESLTSVTIPNSVTSIGDRAFGGCSGLTSLTIPENVDTIGEGAFQLCIGLTSVTSLAQTPPHIVCRDVSWYAPAFSDYSATLFVPRGSKEAYQTAREWSEFTTIYENGFDGTGWVTVLSNDTTMGSVTGGGKYEVGEEITLEAFPKEGYYFVRWDDGNTDNPRTLTVAYDITLTAIFAKEGEDPTANENAGADNFRVYVQERTIYLSEDRGAVQVYNMAGQRIYNGHATAIPVRQSGVYILAVGQQRIKVLVR